MTTTAIIVSLIILVVIAGIQGNRVSDLRAETRTLRRRNEWLETDLAASKNRGVETVRSLRSEIEALAGVVASNADRCTRLEGEDAPRRPACPTTYLQTTYPKRADEL